MRTADAVPATIGLIDGRVRVGLDADEIARFTDPQQDIVKVSHRDLTERRPGATTVAATLACAARAAVSSITAAITAGRNRGSAKTQAAPATVNAASGPRVGMVACPRCP